VLAADLDRDGRDDLVAADEAGGRVAVLRNTGGGAFAAPVFFPAGARPVALVAATLDAGPTPDLAVADASGDAVVILLGDGAGGFLPGGSFPAGAAPEALAAADLDGDLDVDLAVVGAGRPVPPTPGTIRVLHNDGAANFAASTALPGAFLRPSAVVAADLDGDLDRDLAVADAGTATLLVYANAAGFGAPAPHAVGPEPRGVVAADLDRDGDPDLAVACLGLPGQPGSLAVLRGLPGIAFTPATFSAAGAALTSLAAADLGQDEDLDVAATDVASYRLRLQLSHSGTAFGPSTSCAAGTLPFHVAVGEWNQDFTPDLVVADPAAGTVQVLQAIPRPLAIRYGAGCGGTAGVPVLTAVGLPALGNFGFALTLTSARPLTGTMLLIALDRDDRPAGGGCRVLVGGNFSLLLNFTDGSGFSVTPLPVPADAILGGVNVYAQWAVFDPLGALGGTFALTGGLRLKLGFPYQ
jgi:hypothetical protein